MRSPARVVEARVVSFCRDCAADPLAPLPAAPAEQALAPQPPKKRSRFRLALGLPVVVAGMAANMVGAPSTASAPIPALPPIVLPPPPIVLTAAPPLVEPVTAAPAPRPRAPRLVRGTFVHPLAGTVRYLPETEGRQFGAVRTGGRNPGCGAGHCGVDLGHVEGTIVVASRDGSVEKVVRKSQERGGRWVQLRHAGGMSTFYFHLDEIFARLEPGARVAAGEPIGTLGQTGIRHSAPHLHFAITVDSEAGQTYVDPVPYLQRATLTDVRAEVADLGR